MPNEDFTPLTLEDLEGLKDALARLDQADIILDKSQRAGIDVTEQLTKSKETRVQLMKIRQAFFPGK